MRGARASVGVGPGPIMRALRSRAEASGGFHQRLYVTGGVRLPVFRTDNVRASTWKRAAMLPCLSPRSIRAFLMWSPRVRGSQLFVLPALRPTWQKATRPWWLRHARVTRKALGDCRRAPARLRSRHSRLLPASARASRTGVFPPVNTLRPAHSPQGAGCRPPTHPRAPANPPGAPRTALPAPARTARARPARPSPLRKGIERPILCSLRAVHRKAHGVPITTRLTGMRCCGPIATRV